MSKNKALCEYRNDICRESFVFAKGDDIWMIYLDDIELLLHEKIIFDRFMERHFDRILCGHDLRYAPARHLVKRSLIPPKTKIPIVKFVDINGKLIQLEELDRRYRQAQLTNDFNEYVRKYLTGFEE